MIRNNSLYTKSLLFLQNQTNTGKNLTLTLRKIWETGKQTKCKILYMENFGFLINYWQSAGQKWLNVHGRVRGEGSEQLFNKLLTYNFPYWSHRPTFTYKCCSGPQWTKYYNLLSSEGRVIQWSVVKILRSVSKQLAKVTSNSGLVASLHLTFHSWTSPLLEPDASQPVLSWTWSSQHIATNKA